MVGTWWPHILTQHCHALHGWCPNIMWVREGYAQCDRISIRNELQDKTSRHFTNTWVPPGTWWGGGDFGATSYSLSVRCGWNPFVNVFTPPPSPSADTYWPFIFLWHPCSYKPDWCLVLLEVASFLQFVLLFLQGFFSFIAFGFLVIQSFLHPLELLKALWSRAAFSVQRDFLTEGKLTTKHLEFDRF